MITKSLDHAEEDIVMTVVWTLDFVGFMETAIEIANHESDHSVDECWCGGWCGDW